MVFALDLFDENTIIEKKKLICKLHHPFKNLLPLLCSKFVNDLLIHNTMTIALIINENLKSISKTIRVILWRRVSN
jgi:hypothetical protein